jgi:hypothetical protein
MSERRERGQINKNMQQINHYVRSKATPYTDHSMLKPTPYTDHSMLKPLHCHRPKSHNQYGMEEKRYKQIDDILTQIRRLSKTQLTIMLVRPLPL